MTNWQKPIVLFSIVLLTACTHSAVIHSSASSGLTPLPWISVEVPLRGSTMDTQWLVPCPHLTT